jgi:isopentenyldiphosphate isomerase/intracellular septation protein A
LKQVDLIKKLLPGFIPLLVFIIADEIWGMKVGLIVALIIGIAELIFTWFREKRFDRFILLDTALLVALSGISILLENDIFFKLKPALIELILCAILAFSLFTRIDVVGTMTARYMKGVAMSGQQSEMYRKSLRNLFWIVLVHSFLVVFAAFYLGNEAWAFISGGMFYIVFGVFFIYEFFKNRRKNMSKANSLENEEWLPVVDEDGRVTGKAPRSVFHSGSKLLHPVVHLHVIGPKKSVYLQKRPMNKLIQPGKWDTAVGGHISFGEQLEESLKREAFEEIGLENFKAVPAAKYRWDSDVESELVYSFITNDYQGIHIHTDEVDEGKFWPVSEIEKLIGKGVFTPNFEYEFQMLRKAKVLK